MRHATRPCVLLLLGAASALPAQDGLRNTPADGRHLQLETYDVAGETATDLRRELGRRGPLDDDGRRFDARTRWHVRWRFDLQPTAAGCRAVPTSVDVEVTITLPHWRRSAGAPEGLVRRWERYLAILRRHEDGHADVGHQAAQAIWQVLADRPEEADCGRAELAANRAAQAEIARAQERDRRYDRETDHGATQGARFP